MNRGVCIEILETGERKLIETPVWVMRNKNKVIRTPHQFKAQGICDGNTIWSFGSLESYPEARVITRAEYEERPGLPDENQAVDIGIEDPQQGASLIIEGGIEN